jgi:hypothetical protein
VNRLRLYPSHLYPRGRRQPVPTTPSWCLSCKIVSLYANKYKDE